MRFLRSRRVKPQPGEGRKRTFWFTTFHTDIYGGNHHHHVKDEKAGNLVSSLTNDNLHMPVIDFDFSCELLPSSTQGHFHLFVNKPIEWDKYEKLLDVLFEIGYLDSGWYEQAKKDHMSFVRKPGVYKDSEAAHRSIKDGLEKGQDLFSVVPTIAPDGKNM